MYLKLYQEIYIIKLSRKTESLSQIPRVCVALYVLCVALSVVAWDVLCLYCGFLPSLDVPFPVIVALVNGRISSLSLYI